MSRADCSTCAGTGVAFGKHCDCQPEAPPVVGSPEFWQIANAWAGATMDTAQRAVALVEFIREAAAADLSKCRHCGNLAALSAKEIEAQRRRYDVDEDC